jgi:hypothetical protein
VKTFWTEARAGELLDVADNSRRTYKKFAEQLSKRTGKYITSDRIRQKAHRLRLSKVKPEEKQ